MLQRGNRLFIRVFYGNLLFYRQKLFVSNHQRVSLVAIAAATV